VKVQPLDHINKSLSASVFIGNSGTLSKSTRASRDGVAQWRRQSDMEPVLVADVCSTGWDGAKFILTTGRWPQIPLKLRSRNISRDHKTVRYKRHTRIEDNMKEKQPCFDNALACLTGDW